MDTGCCSYLLKILTLLRPGPRVDNIVVIKEGNMVEQGTHEQLLEIEIKRKKDDGKDDTYQGMHSHCRHCCQ